ncbi:hypothetical protein [Pseudomonas syringae]|uniref:hypothetical protein n=1 Tax=Pseudomonas syringae TaxID=317 RepID=UPI003F775D90
MASAIKNLHMMEASTDHTLCLKVKVAADLDKCLISLFKAGREYAGLHTHFTCEPEAL